MILVVGGAGYIGSHVNKMLAGKNYETVIYDNLIYGHQEAVKWGILEVGDLADQEKLEEIFTNYEIEAVMHFAAYAYVGESVSNPSKYYRNNVGNTLNLLDAMIRHNVNNIIFSSTCATYGVPQRIPITEDMQQNPVNPYGKTKLMVEKILEDYHKAYGLNYCCLRYFNAAGADPEGELGESHTPETHLIPLVLAAAAGDSEAITVFGTDYDTEDGSCIRDYIHVEDLADAHLRALNYLMQGGESTCINLGNEQGNSVFEIIQTAEQITGKHINVVYGDRRMGDPDKLVGSAGKAWDILGWKPKYPDIGTIILHAWRWYCKKSY